MNVPNHNAPGIDAPRATAVWPIVLAFVVAAALWFTLGGQLIDLLLGEPAHAAQRDWIEGGVFTVISAAILYGLMRHQVNRVEAANAREREAFQVQEHASRLLRAIAENSSDAIFAKDREGRYQFFNAEAARVTGQSASKVIGQDDRALFPPAQAAEIRANDERVMSQARAQTFEEVLDTADGHRTYLAMKGPLRDRQGEVIGLYGISRDVTELLAGQLQLRESERKYRFMFDASPQPMWAFDRESLRFVAVNDAAVTLYGYSREEFLALTIADIRPPDERDRLFREIEAGLLDWPYRSGVSRQWTHRRKDGSLIQVELAANNIVFEGHAARLILITDVTERLQLERDGRAAFAEATASRDLLHDVLERVDDGFVALDAGWRYTYLNVKAAALLGREVGELIGKHIWTEFPEGVDQPFYRAYHEALQTQKPVIFEDFFAPWKRWYENRVYPSPQGLSIYFTDITDRRRAERILRDRERDFRALAEQMPAIIYRATLGPKGETTYVSPYIRVLGYTPEQWLAQGADRWARTVHPDDVDRARAERSAGRESGGEYLSEYRLRDAMGRWRHFRDTGRCIEPDDGSPPFVQGLAIDISDHVEFEVALRDSEAQLRLSEQRYRLAAVEDRVWEWDAESGVLLTSPRLWSLLDIDPPEDVDAYAALKERMPTEDAARMEAALLRHFKTREPYDLEFRARAKDRGLRWMHVNGQALWNEQGRAVYMAGTTVDITDRKHAEAALREAEAYRRSLFDQMADGVLLLDGDLQVIDANPKARQLFGYPANALPGPALADLLSQHDRERIDVDLKLLASDPGRLLEWEVVRRDGGRFPAEVSVRSMLDERVVAVLRDVSVRYQTEKALLSYQLELSELTQRLLTQEKITTQRVAQALHDNLGQTLAVARLNLDAAMAAPGQSMPAGMRSHCQTVSALLDQAVRETRQVLADLRPPYLDEQGLAAALENEVQHRSVEGGHPDVLLEADDNVAGQRWPGDVEYSAFMIARESVANAQRHAGASLVRVLLSGDAHTMTVEVLDDGVGIPFNLEAGRPGHLGIVGMRERAIAIGARLDVLPGAEGGTHVRLRWTS